MKKIRQILAIIKNPRFLRPILGVLFVLVILGIFIFFEKKRDRVFVDNSLIEAPVVNVTSINPGKLAEIDVYEGEKVKKGDVLAVVGTDTLRADTDGLIIMANKQIGGTMTVQNPVVQMINLSEMRVAGTIDENKGLNKIKVGQAVSFTIDALPGKTFWGYIDEVSSTAKQTQLTFSISSERPVQQFEVYTRFDTLLYPEIKNGMSAKMTVYTQQP